MKKQTIFFTGLDLDSDNSMIGNHLASPPSPAGSYRRAYNIRVGHDQGGKGGVLKNLKGTILVPWADKPIGNLICIGTTWEEKRNQQIGFFYNSTGYHCIAVYKPVQGSVGKVETIVADPVLNFDRDKLITGAKVIDGRYLVWTETNNIPRTVDLEKANLHGKRPEIRLYFRRYDGTNFTDRSFDITITNGIVTIPVSPVHISSVADVKDFNRMIRTYASSFNGNNFLNQYATAEACGDFVHIRFIEGDWSITAKSTDYLAGTPGAVQDQMWVYENRYSGFTEHNLSLCFWPWNHSPVIDFVTDPSRIDNYLHRTTLQFAVVYRAWDNRRSVLSGYSELAVDIYSTGTSQSLNNCIEIDFSNPELTDRDFLSVVKNVEIMVRYGNNLPWKSVTILEHSDFVYGQVYRFYNDGMYPEMDPAYAQKINEAIALRAKSLDVVNDNENNTRLLLGGLIEGYDNFCPDVKLNLTYDSSDRSIGGWIIEMPIYIHNDSVTGNYSGYQPIHDLGSDHAGGSPGHIGSSFGGVSGSDVERGVGTHHEQWIPAGGFIGYLAGTPHYGISEQNNVTYSGGGGTLTIDNTTGNVYDSQNDGLPVPTNFLRRKGKSAIRYMIENTNGVYSMLRITGVPEGEYVLRIASHWCASGDPLGKGTMYDLDDPSRSWHKTSTFVAEMNGLSGATEVRVSIPAGTGTLTLGRCVIKDLTSPGVVGSRSMSGYVIDNNADIDDATLREEGVTMEKQAVVLKDSVNPFSFLTRLRITDHNGFFYFSVPNDGTSLRLGVVGATGDPANPVSAFGVPNFGNIAGGSRQIIKDLTQTLYEGGLDTNVPLAAVASTLTFSGAEHRSYILPNHNQNAADILRTTIEGTIVDGVGNGVGGIPVVFTGTGRVGLSGTDGSYRIVVWADSMSPNQRSGILIFIEDTSLVSYTITPATSPEVITSFDLGAQWSRNVPYQATQVVAVLRVGTGNIITWKRRSSYYIGIEYIDPCGVRTMVNLNEQDTNIYIPGENDDLHRIDPDRYPVTTFERGRVSIEFSINHEVPLPEVGRLTHYRFVRTFNTLYSKYIQWIVANVRYAEKYDRANNIPIVTSYGSGTAREVFLNIGLGLTTYKEENEDSTLGYTYQSGDRCIFIMKDDGTYYDKIYDFPVKGQIGDDVIIEALPSMPEIKAGTLIEIYTPSKDIEDRIYYEFGPCYDINDPYTNPTHSVTSGILQPGDCYWRRREVIIEPILAGARVRMSTQFENESVSDFFVSREYSLGKINQEDKNAKQLHRETAIRISNPYLSGTSINGFGEFEGLNIKEFSKDYGLIQKMAKVGEVLLCICENRRTITLYMGKSEVKVGMNQAIMTVVDKILGTVYEQAHHYGTVNPESFVEDSTYAYWVDAKTGTVVRYTVNGLHALESQYYAKRLGNDIRRLDNFGNTRIYGTFDSFHKEYIFSIEGQEIRDDNGDIVVEVQPKTMVFHESKRDAQDESRFIAELEFYPEWLCRQELQVLSVKGGDWYLHNEGPVNEFYGAIKYPRVEIVANQEPTDTKVFKSIELNSYQDGWEVPSIRNGEGQISLIPASVFRDYEGSWRAPILRDITSPGTYTLVLQEGREMRAKECIIEIVNKSSGEIVLNSVEVNYVSSRGK